MAFQFPWTNFHELNLDWFLSKFKQFANNFLETTATAESVPYGTQPSVTVTGGELDDDTDIVDPFNFNFKIPAGQPGAPGAPGAPGTPGQDGFSPVATVTKSGTVATITITDANGTTTTTISDGTVTQAQLDTKAPLIIATASGSVANFKDGADNMSMHNIVADIDPVQDLSNGDPSPTNICPITGHTEMNVYKAGKNLFSGDTQYTRADAGYYIKTGTYSPLPLMLPKGTYTISIKSTAGGQGQLEIFGNSTSNRLINASMTIVVGVASYTFTISEDCGYIRFYGNFVGTISNIQIEAGATATTYEAYATPTTINVSWQTEAGTVYGGNIDLSTGVLTVTHGYVVFDGSETWTQGSNNRYYTSVADAYTQDSTRIEVICNAGVFASSGSAVGTVFLYNQQFFYYAPSTITTEAEFKTWLTNNNIQIVYALATPQTYQLTPQQLFNTLYGVNNVWSDTGDSTVTYPADTKLFIEQLTQPTEDDMTANTAIASGKFFMIGNNLYRATTAIASGSQIIPGTNATPMSLADALNLL